MKGLLVLALLTNSVLSVPVTPPENDDVKVMKCIVEVLADVLSKPHPRPVSQECMLTLKTDERLVPILRHMNFLEELQEIALKDSIAGHEERGQLTPDHVTQAPQSADMADRSMLEALGGPGERSILSQKNEDEEERDERRGQDREELQQDYFGEVTREHEEKPKSSESPEEWDLEKKREEEESGERRANMKAHSDETSEEDDSGEPKHSKSQREKKRHHGNEKERRAELVSHSHEDEEEEERMKSGSKEGLFSSMTKRFPLKKTNEKELQGGSHHSKEVSEEEEEEEEVEEKKKRNAKKSPEEKELQMIAQRTPEEKKVLEEEGSAVRKSEDQEIESLAAIESELENVAQKLHDLRRG
ncbi:chromogranin-A [Neosynchiropus ocellatus]